MSEEDYEAQMALITKVDPNVSFSPDGPQYYIGDDDAGYGFMSEYDAINYSDPVIEAETYDRPTTDTLWAKAVHVLR